MPQSHEGTFKSTIRRRSIESTDSADELKYYQNSNTPVSPISQGEIATEKSATTTPQASNREYCETNNPGGLDLEIPLDGDSDDDGIKNWIGISLNKNKNNNIPPAAAKGRRFSDDSKVVRRYREEQTMSMRTVQFGKSSYEHNMEAFGDEDDSSSESSSSIFEYGNGHQQGLSGPKSSPTNKHPSSEQQQPPPPPTSTSSFLTALTAVAGAIHRFSPPPVPSKEELKRRSHRRRESNETYTYPRSMSHHVEDATAQPLLAETSGVKYYGDEDEEVQETYEKITFDDEENPDSNAGIIKKSMTIKDCEADLPAAAAFAAAKYARQQRSSSSSRTNPDEIYSTGRENISQSIKIAATFLMDYEAARPPSLASHIDSITSSQLWFCQMRHSTVWQATIVLAAAALFFASSIEGDAYITSDLLLAALTFFSVVVFVCDMLIRTHYKGNPLSSDGGGSGDNNNNSNHHLNSNSKGTTDELIKLRKGRAGMWMVPLSVLLFALSINTAFNLMRRTDDIFRRAIWLSVLKPIALFYISSKARDALEAVYRVVRIVTRVLCVELFLILSFAAVACHVYSNFPGFENLSKAFVSLFELSTTVVNPSIWMPVYNSARSSAFFFILFVVTSVFYLHSLVLSVVFQTYMQAMAEIRDRSRSDREDALRLAFLTLQKDGDMKSQTLQLVHVHSLRQTLALLRPHYGPMKINALLQIVEPDHKGYVDYKTFRMKLPKALRTSLMSTRPTTPFSLALELLALVVAVSNLVYVILVSSSFETLWWQSMIVPIGSLITLLGVAELILRSNFLKRFDLASPTRLDGTFDGLATFAGVLSIYGILCHMLHYEPGVKCILIGRSIDMIRFMRFFSICRDIVKRTGQVLPAIIGPLVLVFSAMHIFTYIGMAIWGGAVQVGSYAAAITPFYDLNNFNTYSSGLVTMFQVLVVNDWHAIAEVYLLADRFSSPIIVYTFFIGGNLIGVSILLNVLTAFFVGAFVTKVSAGVSVDASKTKTWEPDLVVESIRSVKSFSNMDMHRAPKGSSLSHSSSSMEFAVSERQCFDKIMNTVAGGGDENDSSTAQKACDYLEVFESLTPGRDKVGYMVCCQKTSDRIGNRRFEAITKKYLNEDIMHMVVSDMHAELVDIVLSSSSHTQVNDSAVERTFQPKRNSEKVLVLSAALLEEEPPVSLFTARTTLSES